MFSRGYIQGISSPAFLKGERSIWVYLAGYIQGIFWRGRAYSGHMQHPFGREGILGVYGMVYLRVYIWLGVYSWYGRVYSGYILEGILGV